MKMNVFWICALLFMFSLAACSSAPKTNAAVSGNPVQTNTRTAEKTSDTSSASAKDQLAYDGNYPQHEVYGTGIGVMPGRVVWAHNPAAVEWDGKGYWWAMAD